MKGSPVSPGQKTQVGDMRMEMVRGTQVPDHAGLYMLEQEPGSHCKENKMGVM